MTSIDISDAAQVEACALAGRELGHWHGTGSDGGAPRGGDTGSPDIGWARIASGGCGNAGFMVPVGITPRGRAICRAGRIARLTREGIPATVATVAASMPYGMEPAVARMAADLAPVLARVPGLAKPSGRPAWQRALGWVPETSMPRAWAAWDIAARVAGGAR